MFSFGCDGIEDCIQLPPLWDASDAAFFDSDIVGYGISGDDGDDGDDGEESERGARSEVSTICSYGSNGVTNSIPKMAKFLPLF
jgi:hypothetical protein